jgi:hypothetical protein
MIELLFFEHPPVPYNGRRGASIWLRLDRVHSRPLPQAVKKLLQEKGF